MHLDNPAIYECNKNPEYKVHYWHFHDDGTAVCCLCDIELTKSQADEVKYTGKDNV